MGSIEHLGSTSSSDRNKVREIVESLQAQLRESEPLVADLQESLPLLPVNSCWIFGM